MAHAFTLEELLPTASGWSTDRPPDFVGIGAPKAGTTWWYTLLQTHPEIVPNRLGRKELHYFAGCPDLDPTLWSDFTHLKLDSAS